MTIKKRRVIMAFFGVIITGLCVGGLQKANLGTDPFTSFVTGIANLFKSRYSVFYVVITGILLLGIFLIDKHYIGIATVINLLLTGGAADMMHHLLDSLIPFPGLFARFGIMAVSLVFTCFSAALYFSADLGVSAYDAWVLIASDRQQVVPFKFCRIITDSFCVLIGFIFGATVGIGTVLTAFCMGPLTNFFREKITNPMLEE